MRFFLVLRNNVTDDPLITLVQNHRHVELVDDPREADGILVLGGDGTMLHAVRNYYRHRIPFYGLKLGEGSIAFLATDAESNLVDEVLHNSVQFVEAFLLSATMYDQMGACLGTHLAFNDCYFSRLVGSSENDQAAHLRITVNDVVYFDRLICDGIIVATSTGSTAYSGNAGGAILLPDDNAIVLTAVAPARHHRWNTATLSRDDRVVIDLLNTHKRPAGFFVDGLLSPNAARAEITGSDVTVRLAFAQSYDFRKKSRDAQFPPRT